MQRVDKSWRFPTVEGASKEVIQRLKVTRKAMLVEMKRVMREVLRAP